MSRLPSETVPLLAQAGVDVLMPAELDRSHQRLRARMRLGPPRDDLEKDLREGVLGLDALAQYRWEVALGDEVLSPEEFLQLCTVKQPLVRWRDKWLVIDPRDLAQLANLMRDARDGSLQRTEALRAALLGEVETGGIRVEAVAQASAQALLDALQSALKPLPAPAGFVGSLRPYQERGLGFLVALSRAGLGGRLPPGRRSMNDVRTSQSRKKSASARGS